MGEIMTTDTIKDKVRERIQKEFVTLIPKEAWKQLVDGEINWLVSPRKEYGRENPSLLKEMIREQLREIFAKQIKEELAGMQAEDWNAEGRPCAGPAVRLMVKQLAPELWELAIRDVIQRAVDGLRVQIQQP